MWEPATLRLNGADLLADLSGALFWPERRLLAVADLHLEKGSGFAARGLPPYDTAPHRHRRYLGHDDPAGPRVVRVATISRGRYRLI
jgi:hypothetical protein